MKIFTIGTYSDEKLLKEINQKSASDSQVSVAAIKYSRFIERGFDSLLKADADHTFVPPVGMFPSSKFLFWTKTRVGGVNYVPFINFFGIKQLSIFLYLVVRLLLWSFKNRKEKRVVVFTFLYFPFQAVIPIIRFFFNTKFVSFVPDLPDYEFTYTEQRAGIKKKLIPLYISLSKRVSNFSDYFVFITKYMATLFEKKPYSIVEGFSVATEIDGENFIKSENAIMYSGALFEKFGIKNLLDAFRQLEGNCELWLFGSGDMTDEIKERQKVDKRIRFFGNVSNSEVRRYQKKARLLINPRFSNEDFTKFSFPSKLMEYMASGTPVLTTRLKGIPEDYYDKFYFIDDESVMGMKLAMEKCLQKSDGELLLFGKSAQEYVMKHKNYKVLIGRLLEDLKNVF